MSNNLLSIPGMVSGLPTQSIIQQLVAARQAAEIPLQTQQATINSQIQAWNSLTPALTSFQQSLQTLVNQSTWTAMTTNSSNSSAITASVATGSPAGTYSITSTQLAQSQTSSSTSFASTATVGSAGNTFNIVQGTKTATISLTGAESLATVASAINTQATAQGMALTASVVTSNGQSTLMVSSTQTGTANAFTMTDTSGTFVSSTLNMQTPAATAAQDAKATVNGIALTSSSNTFSNVVNGLTFTLNTAGNAQSTVTVTQNTGAVTTAVNNFMSAYNTLMGTLKSLTNYDTTNNKSVGVLAGDPVVTGLMNNIQAAVSGMVPNSLPNGQPSAFQGLGQLGIVLNSDGTMAYSTQSSSGVGINGQTKFNNALSSNLQDMAALFGEVSVDNIPATKGLGGMLQSLITSATTANTGSIASQVSSLTTENTTITNELDQMDQQNQMYQDQLTAQFNAMELQISQIKSQGNWLNSMMGAMPSSSSSSSSSSGSSSSGA